jgi:hypothetical protein
VFVPQGFTTPNTQPQVTGIGIGSATITASSLGYVSASQPVQVSGTLTITTASLPSGQTNVFYAQPLAATGGTGVYTWSVISGLLPNGLGLNPTTGMISGVPSVAATNTSVTFQVTDTSSPPQTGAKVLTITIVGPLAIATTSLPSGQLGAPYSQTLFATGGTGAHTWALTAGTLPAGLGLNPATGLISGTPTETVTNTPLTFQATDSGSPAQIVSANLTLTITPSLVILTTSLPPGQVGVAYSNTLLATGGTGAHTWALTSGAFPLGLTLNSITGQIVGTPLVAATNTPLTFQTTDSGSPAQIVSANLTLTVAGPLVITTTSLADGQVNAVYSQTLVATGGTGAHTWALIAGSLPTGLTLNPTTGQISGTPTVAVTNTPLTFQTTDSGTPAQIATVNLTLTITGPLMITTTSLPSGLTGSLYSQTLIAIGGTGAHTWSLISGSLPAGLLLNPVTGLVSGTPTATVTNAPLTFQATDSGAPAQTATANLTLTIIAPLVITTTSLPGGQLGSAYSQTLAATGGTGAHTWALIAGALPGGLTLNSVTGQISGTPTVAVINTPLTFQTTDSGAPAQVTTVNLTLSISAAPLAVTTTSLPNGQVNVPYSFTLGATGGVGPYHWALDGGRMVNGLDLNPNGQITGTPLGAVTGNTLTFRVTDSGSPTQTVTVNLSLTVN